MRRVDAVPTGWFGDADRLVLLVVGTTHRHLTPKHKRLKSFLEGDYDRLIWQIAGAAVLDATQEPAGGGAVRTTSALMN